MEPEGLTAASKRPVILCFVAYYLPGYRSGGPVRSIANFVDHLGDEFEIRIVTRDRDALDSTPYEGVAVDCWNRLGKASVFYASSKTLTLFGIAKLIRNTSHDILYLNSFFAFKFTILPLLARRLALVPNKPCVIAPRGEFSVGALALKPQKKQLYLKATKAIKLHSHLIWQASSEFESADIQREMGVDADAIQVAPNLQPAEQASKIDGSPAALQGDDTELHIIFLSRITSKKNLDFLLEALHSVQFSIVISIFGPIEERNYWVQCQSLIATLPSNVKADYMGEVDPHRVLDVFSSFDLFVLPTRGENYGHVVLESLAAGTPVLISDQTPWLASSDGAIQVLSLGDPLPWAVALDRWAALSRDQRFKLKSSAYNYAKQYVERSTAIDSTRSLFIMALHGSSL